MSIKNKFGIKKAKLEDDLEEYFPEGDFHTGGSGNSSETDDPNVEFDPERSGIFDDLDIQSIDKLRNCASMVERSLDSKGILIVDDEPMIQTLIQKYLEKIIDENTKKKIVFAKDGKDAIQKLLNQEFGLIIVDLEMPRMHGFEFIKLLKQKNKTRKVPIMIISGNLYQKSVKEAVYLGVKEVLAKPFNFKTFTDRIHRVLKISKAA